jgi:hypothetical protein
MSAQTIYDSVPLGSLVRYSDGTPRPPERFKKKLSAWENTNNGGRLVHKSAPHTVGTHTTPASVTLHQGDFGSAGDRPEGLQDLLGEFAIDVHRDRTPEAWNGARSRSYAELLHLADTRAAAEAWLGSHRYPDAVLDEVADDERTPELPEGRAA